MTSHEIIGCPKMEWISVDLNSYPHQTLLRKDMKLSEKVISEMASVEAVQSLLCAKIFHSL
jgi:hypothetical protein